MTASPSTQRSPSLLRLWWTVDRASLLRLAALALALLSFLWLWPSLIEVGGAAPVLRNLALHAYVLVWLAVVTVGVRTVGAREILTAFLLGVFLVPTIVFGLIWPVLTWLDPSGQALAVWWVPPLEESALLAVIGLQAWRLTRSPGRRPAALDLVVLGFATGGGYAVHEDALYGRLLASWTEGTFSGGFGGPYTWLFPTFATDLPGGVDVVVYHGGSAAFLGLALGVALLLRRRFPAAVWLVPGFWVYAVLTHAVGNQLNYGTSPLAWLLVDGHGVPVLLLLGLLALLVLEHLRRRTCRLDLPAFGWRGLRDITRHGDGTADVLLRALAFGRYHRARNAAITAAWHRPDAPPPNTRGVEGWGRLAFGGLGVRRLADVGTGPDEPPDPGHTASTTTEP